MDNRKPLNKVAVDTIIGKVLHIDKNIKVGGVLQNWEKVCTAAQGAYFGPS